MIRICDFGESIERTVIVDERRDMPRLRCNGGYALMQISRRWPDKRILTIHPEDSTHPDQQDLIIYGEGDGVHIDLFEWWTQQVETRDDVVVIDGKRPRTPLSVRLRSGPPEAGASAAVIDDVAKAANHETVRNLDHFFASVMSGGEEALARLRAVVASAGPRRLHLLIRDFEAMGQHASTMSAILASFRDSETMRERPAPSPLVVVIGCMFETSLFTRLGESGYLRKSAEFRLPSFTADDLEALASWYRYRYQGGQRPPSGLEVGERQAIVHGTGGQPDLVHDVLRFWMTGNFESGAWRSALADLRDSPPGYTRRWSENLRKLVDQTENPAVARRIRGYVQGETTLVDDAIGMSVEDRALYCSGWLGVSAAGKWGIRSPVHRALARRVLSGLR